jgi:hypothetical protein
VVLEEAYRGVAFSCLTKKSTFPTIATALFRPSDNWSTEALLYEEFTYRWKGMQQWLVHSIWERKKCMITQNWSVPSRKNTKESGNLHLTAARDDAKEASRLVLAWPYKFKPQKNQLNLRRKGAFTHTHTLYVRSDIKERLTQLVKLNYAFWD